MALLIVKVAHPCSCAFISSRALSSLSVPQLLHCGTACSERPHHCLSPIFDPSCQGPAGHRHTCMLPSPPLLLYLQRYYYEQFFSFFLCLAIFSYYVCLVVHTYYFIRCSFSFTHSFSVSQILSHIAFL